MPLKYYKLKSCKILKLAMAMALFISNVFTLNLEAQTTLKTGLSITERRGVNLKLIPETLVDTSMSLEGDYFSAFLTKPSAELLNVPLGSRLLGEVTEIKRPRSFGRTGLLKTHVDKLMLPDGSLVKISADFSSKAAWKDKEDPKTLKNLAKKITKTSSEITASSMVGAVDAVQYAGLGTAISTSGLSVAAGAALGLGLGLVGAVKNKGEELISSGFDPVNFRLESDFQFLEELPLMAQKIQPLSAKLLGINIQVNQIEKYYSKDYGEFLVLDVNLNNDSLNKLYLGDFVLSSNRHILPVYNNPFLTDDSFSSLEVDSSKTCKLAFSLGDLKKTDNYQLMMLDPLSQEIIANLDIDISTYL